MKRFLKNNPDDPLEKDNIPKYLYFINKEGDDVRVTEENLEEFYEIIEEKERTGKYTKSKRERKIEENNKNLQKSYVNFLDDIGF